MPKHKKPEMTKGFSLVYFGNPLLRKKAKAVSSKEQSTPAFKAFIADMFAACKKFHGVGIAAPQLTQSKKVFVMSVRKTNNRRPTQVRREVFINPEIIEYSPQIVRDWEGCLSLPKVVGKVPRSKRIDVMYTNAQGERIHESFSGLEARIIQHEVDHLNGILYVDRMDDMTSLITRDELQKRTASKKKQQTAKK